MISYSVLNKCLDNAHLHRSTEWVGIAESDSRGLYSVSVPRPGTYGVNAFARGSKCGVGEVVLGSRSQAVDVQLEVQGCPPEVIQTVPGHLKSHNTSLSGTVWEVPRLPAHNAKVRLLSGRSITLESSTDSGGHFLFRHVPPGPYDLVINDPRYRDVMERSLWIVSGRRATVELRCAGRRCSERHPKRVCGRKEHVVGTSLGAPNVHVRVS